MLILSKKILDQFASDIFNNCIAIDSEQTILMFRVWLGCEIISLSFVDEEGDLFELEVEKAIFLMHCMTSEVVA